MNWYGDGWRSDNNVGTGTGNQKVMLQRVPNYNNVTVNGTLSSNPWDGNKYGVTVFRVANNLTGSGSINANGGGFAGGSWNVPSKYGESYPGWTGSIDYGGGAPGGRDYDPYRGYGGGGGYGTNGGTAGLTGKDGSGGLAYGGPDLKSVYLGAGGGAGGDLKLHNPGGLTPPPDDLPGGDGGHGGGILFVAGKYVNFQGTLASNGATVDWRFTTADARIKLKRLYPAIRLPQNVHDSALIKA